jgi:dTDP-4-dehydrorhamnose reductase
MSAPGDEEHRILLLGRTGQTGWELQRSLSPLGQVTTVDSFDRMICLTSAEPINPAPPVTIIVGNSNIARRPLRSEFSHGLDRYR